MWTLHLPTLEQKTPAALPLSHLIASLNFHSPSCSTWALPTPGCALKGRKKLAVKDRIDCASLKKENSEWWCNKVGRIFFFSPAARASKPGNLFSVLLHSHLGCTDSCRIALFYLRLHPSCDEASNELQLCRCLPRSFSVCFPSIRGNVLQQLPSTAWCNDVSFSYLEVEKCKHGMGFWCNNSVECLQSIGRPLHDFLNPKPFASRCGIRNISNAWRNNYQAWLGFGWIVREAP